MHTGILSEPFLLFCGFFEGRAGANIEEYIRWSETGEIEDTETSSSHVFFLNYCFITSSLNIKHNQGWCNIFEDSEIPNLGPVFPSINNIYFFFSLSFLLSYFN